ncbi:MAG: MFS transporter [Oribacterium sp.]|nr:MFS transporter [Oribacterium sp.]
MRTYVAKRGSEDIAYLLFAVIFMNGFETGGYQAALMAIGNTYGMNEAQEGLLASTELFATMIAPLILGSVADRVGKKKMLLLFTFVRVLSCFIMLPSGSTMVFAVGIFFMGFAKSIIQYVAIAAMQDTYPVTGGTKTGLITAMYATGAFVAPYVVGFAGGTALSWKMTILVDLIISAALFVLFSITDFSVREQKPIPTGDVAPQAAEPTGKIYAQGVFVLCFIMFIYVGAENGIGFFLNDYMTSQLKSSIGYAAVSIFWLMMIPSRILSGIFSRYHKHFIIFAPLGAAALLFLLPALTQEALAFILIAALGFCCGAVYPNVLNFAYEYAAGKTATVDGFITFATGVGGTVVSAAFGFLLDGIGFKSSFIVLALVMSLDIFAGLWCRHHPSTQ